MSERMVLRPLMPRDAPVVQRLAPEPKGGLHDPLACFSTWWRRDCCGKIGSACRRSDGEVMKKVECRMQNPGGQAAVTGCWRGRSQGVESGRGLPHSKTLRRFGGGGGWVSNPRMARIDANDGALAGAGCRFPARLRRGFQGVAIVDP